MKNFPTPYEVLRKLRERRDHCQNLEWSEWRKTWSFIPRKSISGKWIIGRINKRSSTQHRMRIKFHFFGIDSYEQMVREHVREFAMSKELFEHKLKGNV